MENEVNNEVSRLYLALWPDRDTKNKLESMRHTWTWPRGASIVKPESLHLTLHFMGDVPNQRIPELTERLKLSFEPFDLMLSRHQLWPRGVAVFRPNSIPAELNRLYAGLGDRLRESGIPTEKRTYRPHVTLARNAADAIAPTIQQMQPVLWHVNGYALVKSHHGYSILHRYVSG